MRVLITGSRAPVALDLARRFCRAGHTVLQADSLPHGMAMRSNAVQQAFTIPRPVEDIEAFAAAVTEIVTAQDVELLVPTCEEVFFLAACRDQIPCRVFCDLLPVLHHIHNKWLFTRMVTEAPVSAPDTFLLDPQGDTLLDRVPSGIRSEDWVFKPVYSRFASRTLVGPSVKQLAGAAAGNDQWVMQRRICGTEYSTWSIAESGRLLVHAAYESLYRVGRGSGICFSPVRHERIVEFVRWFAERHSYTGQLGVDFIQNDSGELFVLEGNPRGTSGVHLFSQTDPVVEALLGDADVLCQPTPVRPAMVEFAMPFWGLVDAIRRGRLTRFVPDLIQSRWSVTRILDPLPTLGLPLSLWQIAKVARQKRCSLQTASTFDIEWNGDPL